MATQGDGQLGQRDNVCPTEHPTLRAERRNLNSASGGCRKRWKQGRVGKTNIYVVRSSNPVPSAQRSRWYLWVTWNSANQPLLGRSPYVCAFDKNFRHGYVCCFDIFVDLTGTFGMVCQINKTQKLSEWVSKQQESVKRTRNCLGGFGGRCPPPNLGA
jgi:hypothetical protein